MSLKSHIPLLILLIFAGTVSGRLITDDLISDGIHDEIRQNTDILRLDQNNFAAGEESCEQSYGFLPCTKTTLGNVFLIIVYGYLMFLAATYLSSGSELLLEILGPGLIGGLFLPILGAVPDALLILVSGISGSTEAAQSQVSVGMGLLAGSTVMLITVIWGTCCIVGKCDIENSVAIDSKDTKGFSLTGSGVSTDVWTRYAAIIMVVSVVPFLVVQLPQLLQSTSGRHLAVLIALVISLTMLVSYCVYQVFQPWVQRRRLAFVKNKHVMSGVLKHLRMRALGRLCTDEGTPNIEVLEKLFKAIDENKDGGLSRAELKALVVGIRLEEINLNENDAVEKLMKDFDTSHDQKVEMSEFIAGVAKWLNQVRGSKAPSREAGPDTMKQLADLHEQTRMEHHFLGEEQSDESVEAVENPRSTAIKAVLFLLLGTVVAAMFADPLVDAVNNFSSATNIPSFFISFIVLPLATNSSESVSAIIFASRKKLRSASLTYSELYGAVTMNNLLCLSVFLALVYVRGLTWDFSSEVLVILIVCIIMGVFASVRSTFPLWTTFIAFLLYPFSLVLVYVLDYIYGWS